MNSSPSRLKASNPSLAERLGRMVGLPGDLLVVGGEITRVLLGLFLEGTLPKDKGSCHQSSRCVRRPSAPSPFVRRPSARRRSAPSQRGHILMGRPAGRELRRPDLRGHRCLPGQLGHATGAQSQETEEPPRSRRAGVFHGGQVFLAGIDFRSDVASYRVTPLRPRRRLVAIHLLAGRRV